MSTPSTKKTPRTSVSHPMVIGAWQHPGGGKVGLCFCPGKKGDSIFGAPWDRDLEADLDHLKRWGASHVVTLVSDEELVALQVPGLGAAVRAHGMRWHKLTITDRGTPTPAWESLWRQVAPELVDAVRAGQSVFVHCRGGLGRAGTVAALLAIELGEPPATAVAFVRGVRQGTIETGPQQAYVEAYRPVTTAR